MPQMKYSFLYIECFKYQLSGLRVKRGLYEKDDLLFYGNRQQHESGD